jgi:nucleoside-diphosphate-sugar epimerase
MKMKRRTFVRQLGTLAGSAAASLVYGARAWASPPKRLLVIGGTDFVGPAVVNAGVIAGHHVTLFNRGVTNPELFPYLEHLHGFRSIDEHDQGFSALSGRTWDAAVDVWPSDPTMVATLAQALKDRVGHYVYVSSCAVYKSFEQPGLTEDAPVREYHGGTPNYADGKSESERRLGQILGQRLSIVRPCSIDGYRNDGANLQTWLTRVQTGGRHIAPGTGEERVQIIDAKDVGRFVIRCIDRALFGVFNVTGESLPFRAFLDACKTATGSDAELVWVPEDFLREQDPAFERFFPLWLSNKRDQGFFEISGSKALDAGLERRSFPETAADVLQWFRERDGKLPTANGTAGHWLDPFPANREAEILDRWRAHHS